MVASAKSMRVGDSSSSSSDGSLSSASSSVESVEEVTSSVESVVVASEAYAAVAVMANASTSVRSKVVNGLKSRFMVGSFLCVPNGGCYFIVDIIFDK